MAHCHYHWGGGITGGLIIIAIGVIFLLHNLGIITQSVWSIMWPSILIIIGIGTLSGSGIRIIRNKREK